MNQSLNPLSSANENLLENWDFFCGNFQDILKQNRERLSFFLNFAEELRRQNISVLPLKGLDLLLRAYPTAGLRAMTDIDLLIKKEDARKVMRILENKGFKRQPDEGLTYISEDGKINLDIIWDFWYLHSPRETQEIWENAVFRQFEGHSVEILAPEDDLIYMVSYVVAHRGVFFDTFIKDLTVFLEKEAANINWARLTAKVKSLKLQTYFFHGLSYAVQKGLSLISDAELAAYKPVNFREKLTAALLAKHVTEASQPKVSYLFTWLGYPGLRGKLKLIREKLTPSPFELEVRRGIRSRFGYFTYLFFHPTFIVTRGFWHILKKTADLKWK